MTLITTHKREYDVIRDDLNQGFKFVWNEEKSDEFKQNMFSDTVQDLLDKCLDTAFSDINQSIEYIVEALRSAAMGMQRKLTHGYFSKNSPWFDSECRRLLQENLVDILSDHPDAFVLCGGDFKARTGNDPDFIEDDILEYIETDTSNWKFLVDQFNLARFSVGKIVNSFGRSLLELCAVLNIHIMNGRCGTDKNIGDFTFLGSMGASVIDYIIT